MIYNKTYMEALAAASLEAEADAAEGEAAMEALNENGEPLDAGSTEGAAEGGQDAEGEGEAGEPETFVPEEAQLEERINAMIPSTIDDILSFADSYDAPEQVEAVFKWDVDDIFIITSLWGIILMWAVPAVTIRKVLIFTIWMPSGA